jgi:hypothetical protein
MGSADQSSSSHHFRIFFCSQGAGGFPLPSPAGTFSSSLASRERVHPLLSTRLVHWSLPSTRSTPSRVPHDVLFQTIGLCYPLAPLLSSSHTRTLPNLAPAGTSFHFKQPVTISLHWPFSCPHENSLSSLVPTVNGFLTLLQFVLSSPPTHSITDMHLPHVIKFRPPPCP